ncbi:flagellar basal-body rod protein FlgF [Buchnera aphidicola]|uniref:flagellar basal-body rod protein FlgF n=1 Tax=Buchnera aphidicola TaxID=9 RepID=UPI003CE4C39E
MDNSIYESMTAANRLLEKQNIISNNLANISTTGFKEKFIFIIHNNINDDYYNNIREYYNLTSGGLDHTNRNLDVYVKGDGWLVVKDANGKEAYTKNGHLNINQKNQLTIQNHTVVGNNCSIIVPNNGTLNILSNGVIQLIQNYHNHIIKNKIGSLKLVHLPINDLIHKENGLFYLKNNSKKANYNTIKHSNDIRLQSGMLESSNVNSAQNMIELISNARQFEMQMKMISTYNQNAEYANQLININN